MTQTVTLDVPLDLVYSAQAVAERTCRRYEDVLADWMRRAGPPRVSDLPDEQVLALCDSMLPEAEQERLSDLLWRQRESQLTADEVSLLDGMLQGYQKALIRKAEALHAAVTRGLRPPLGEM